MNSLHTHHQLPIYVAAGQGACSVWKYGEESPLAAYTALDNDAKFAKARWSTTGLRFGAVSETSLHVWCADTASGQTPLHSLPLPHEATDLAFLNAGTVQCVIVVNVSVSGFIPILCGYVSLRSF